MNNKPNHYSYSAAENKEIKQIREKYESEKKELSKLEMLRKLDKSVTSKAAAFSLTIGVIGVLILGLGLSFILVWAETLFWAGVITGIFGVLIMITAYPVFHTIYERKRKEVAPQIIKLTDELMK